MIIDSVLRFLLVGFANGMVIALATAGGD